MTRRNMTIINEMVETPITTSSLGFCQLSTPGLFISRPPKSQEKLRSSSFKAPICSKKFRSAEVPVLRDRTWLSCIANTPPLIAPADTEGTLFHPQGFFACGPVQRAASEALPSTLDVHGTARTQSPPPAFQVPAGAGRVLLRSFGLP